MRLHCTRVTASANKRTRGVLPRARGVERSAQRANEVKISPARKRLDYIDVDECLSNANCAAPSAVARPASCHGDPSRRAAIDAEQPGHGGGPFLALCSRNAARTAQAPGRQYGHEQHSCRHHPCAAPGRLRTRGPLCGLRSLGHGAPRKARASGTWVLPLRGDGVPLPALRQHDEHAPGPPARADARSTDGRVDWTGLALSPARVTREDEVRCGFRRWATLG